MASKTLTGALAAGVAATAVLAPGTPAVAYTSTNSPTVRSVTVTPSSPLISFGAGAPYVTVNVVFNATLEQAVDRSNASIVLNNGRGTAIYDVAALGRLAYNSTTETHSTTFRMTSSHVGLTYVGVRYGWNAEVEDCYWVDGYWEYDYYWDEYYYVEGYEDCYYDYDSGYEVVNAAKSFTVKSQSRATSNAGPEPVAKGKRLKVKGYVQTATASGGAAGWAGKRVNIYFDPKGTGGVRYMASTYTSSTGFYVKKFYAKKSGKWSVRVAGDAGHLASRSVGDYVKVTS